VVAIGVVLALTGCSQAAALAPVGGNRLSEVRYAAIDVLLDKGVDVLEAPVCSNGSGTEITCQGSTVDGSRIEAESTSGDGAPLTVRVDGDEIFSGLLFDVLDAAARS
jgi:hypothetical protein